MTTETHDTPGSRLRKARERLGLQQIELGRKLGVSGSYISRIERDVVKIQPMVLRLAEALDVSVDYLLVLRDTPQRDATGTALYESTQDELVALRLLRMVIDELPPEDRVRLIHYLIKQAGIYKETFRAQLRAAEPGSGSQGG
jgi:transcriptional regulator with XRE-family HTH domain